MLFNVFNQKLVHLLSTCYSGININNEAYNVICYADDIILASLSIAGLQQLIDTASSFIKAGSLNFNPSETVCTTFGKHHLTTAPKSILNDTIFTEEKQVKYMESILSNNPADHVESRCKLARKAFNALQGAGLGKNGVDSCTIAHIYNVAIKPVLTYGCTAIGLSEKHVTELKKLQGSLTKTALGLLKFCRNTSLMRAMEISVVKQTIDMQDLLTLYTRLCTLNEIPLHTLSNTHIICLTCHINSYISFNELYIVCIICCKHTSNGCTQIISCSVTRFYYKFAILVNNL